MARFEDGIPVPAVRSGPKRKIEWEFMKVGQSIYIEDKKAGRNALLSAQKYAKTAYVCAWRMPDGEQIKPPENVPLIELARILPDGGHWTVTGRKCFTGRQDANGWRIWRVENQPIDPSETVVMDGVTWIRNTE